MHGDSSCGAIREASRKFFKMLYGLISVLMPALFPPQLNYSSANKAIICFQLAAPCPTMEAFSNDGKVLEYNLYTYKVRAP